MTLAALPFALALFALRHADFSGGELYLIACGRHPAWGYTGTPPLVPLLAAVSQLGGESLWLLRMIPALLGIAAVLAACAVVRLLGGGRGAEVMAGLAAGMVPLLLGTSVELSSASAEPAGWTLAAYAALRAVMRGESRWWIVAGAVAGTALAATYTAAVVVAGSAAGLALAGPRGVFANRAFGLGVALVLLLGTPGFGWQAQHGWPLLEAARWATPDPSGEQVAAGPALVALATFAPLWLGGLIELNTRRRTRWLGLGVTLSLLGLALWPGPARAFGAAGPLLFATGAVAVERTVRSTAGRSAYAALTLVVALGAAPSRLPLFGSAASSGWRELADRVAAAERQLPPAERAGAAIFAPTALEAAAVDVFGDGNLPVISAQGDYYFWGPQGDHAVLVVIGRDRRAEAAFADVVPAQPRAPWHRASPAVPIEIARRPTRDLGALWPSLRQED